MVPPADVRVLTVAGSGVLGLAVGSFLNVVIYRVPRGMSVARPPSHCPACQAELRARENIPLLSWLVLRGRCRSCSAPISPRYPLVELATGLAFLAVAWALGSPRPLAPVLAVVAAGVAVAGIRADGLAVPWAVAIGAALGAAGLVPVALVDGRPGALGWAALGAAACAAVAAPAERPGTRAAWALSAAAFGWCAGWLWPPGGPATAGWLALVAVATPVLGARRRPIGARQLGAAAAWIGWLGIILAGALFSRPG